MIPPQLIVAGVIATASAATGFGAAWQVQSWRADAKEKEHVEIALENQRLVAATRTRQDAAVINAQNQAQVRAAVLRVDRDAATESAGRLRDEINRAVRDAATSLDACTVRATTLGELFAESTESHKRLAEAADRHASDIQTLIAAWPR